MRGAAGAAARARAGAAVGWWFGFGYFLAGLWWVGAAFLVEAERFASLMPFAVAGLPAGLALFPAAGTALAAALLPRPGAFAPLVLAAALTLSELARETVLTGFPWNAYGYLWTGSLALAQTAALAGLSGLTFLAVAVGAAPAAALLAESRREGALAAGLAALAVAAMAGWGALRLERLPVGADGEGPPVRIVQPAIPQAEKWLPERAEAIFETILTLTRGEAPAAPGTLLVWPETALPFLYEGNERARRAVDAVLPPGTELLLGAVRRVEGADGPAFLNGVLLLDEAGAVVAAYDKVRLVPFGEYLPFRPLLSAIGLEKLTAGSIDFTPGAAFRPLATGAGEPILALVCYEAIFPDIPRGLPVRPRMIVNVTNDAWFGDTPGPHQHLRQATIRAVETGLPVVRAANTGISAIVDPAGRVLDRLPLGVRGAIDGTVPAAGPVPPAARLGNLPAVGVCLVLFAVAFRRIVRRRVAERARSPADGGAINR